MSDSKTVGAPTSYSLDQLNGFVAQKEGIFGPLVAMGNDGKQSTFSFDQDQNPPTKNATLVPNQGGQPKIPAGSKKVCVGTVFVSGTLTSCTAIRAK